MSNEQIEAFLKFNFIPFSKAQCIKRLIIAWAAGAALCFIGGLAAPWILAAAAGCLPISALFAALTVKHSRTQMSRYLCDGVFWLYIAVMLNLASYRVTVLIIGSDWVLLALQTAVLAVFTFAFVPVVVSNIKHDKYTKTATPPKAALLPCLAAALGMGAAKIFLPGQSQHTSLAVISAALMLLSFLAAIGSVNLLKALMYMRYMCR